MSELRACPFCGATVAVVGTFAEHEFMDSDHPDYEWASKHYDVVCDALEGGCGASCNGCHDTPEKAIEHWNRRAAEPKRGRWIKRGNEKKCSVCGFIYYSNNDEWNGCPNCLADMREGKE
ncbi:MAG: hypothetical protein IJV74_06865 [Clostridia bacterium]|nr:hypothetical protein [Clostridia bacterium]